MEVRTGRSEGRQCVELLGELGHLSAASWTDRAHHISSLGGFLHGGLVVRHSFLLFTFHAEHFSQ